MVPQGIILFFKEGDMTEGQKRRIENRVLFLSIGVMVLLIAFLIFVGVTKQADTLLFPVGLAVGLFVYWVISDVLSVVWLKGFDGKTEGQKKSYYIYALLDLVGFGGLAYFIVEMNSMTGALIYIACLFCKKRFREEYNGITQTTDSGDAESDTQIEAKAENAEAIEATEGAESAEVTEDTEHLEVKAGQEAKESSAAEISER